MSTWFKAHNRVGVRKNRVLVWLVVGTVVVLGGFALVAYRLQPNANEGRYEAAVEYLRHRYAGPSLFYVAPLDDYSTRFKEIPGGYELTGTFRTNDPALYGPGTPATAGEYEFWMEVEETSSFGGLVRSHVVTDFNLCGRK